MADETTFGPGRIIRRVSRVTHRGHDMGYSAAANDEVQIGDVMIAVYARRDEQHARVTDLIAAAPDLYAALATILLNNEIGEYESQVRGLPRLIEVREMARAALAKARGES